MELVHTAFRERFPVEEATWKAVFLILKGGRNYHVIGIVEVVWKAVMVILNCCFAASIPYHDSLHGFRPGYGTETVSPEVKLLQQVSATGEEVLYMIFPDIHKAYDALKGPGAWRS